MQAQGKHHEALDHIRGPGGDALVIAAERGALEGRLMVRILQLKRYARRQSAIVSCQPS